MPPPSAIILVRHGQSEHHVRRLTGGWTDTPLTGLGHEQARLLAARLRAELPARNVRVIASDLSRAAQTAEHVATAFDVAVEFDQRLREHNNGESVNMTIDEARARWPDARDMRMGERMVPGAETGAEFYARARSFIDEMEDDDVLPLVITHGGTIRMMAAAWLRMSDDALDYAHFASHPTGITTLIAWGDDRRERMVERANDIAHLAGVEGWMNLADVLR